MHFDPPIGFKIQRWCFSISVSVLVCFGCAGQDSLQLFQTAPTFHKGRFYTGLGLSATAYGFTLYGLSSAWYKDSDFIGFRFRDDFGEWKNVDKAGHVYTNYFESVWVSNSLQWAGIPRRKAIWYGAGASLLFQSTIEVLDGFSERWGFSWSDMGANLIGTGIFLGQEYLWSEQRIQLKWSTQAIHHSPELIMAENSDEQSSAFRRAEHLFGTSSIERALKDYNGQTIWASFNISDFLSSDNNWPNWLAISIGYGADNLYGGYSNSWSENGSYYDLSHIKRQQQFYIGPDIDWSKIKTHSRFINTLLEMLNALRLPFPALEFNTKGQILWHWVLI